jgi:hypothetical protein
MRRRDPYRHVAAPRVEEWDAGKHWYDYLVVGDAYGLLRWSGTGPDGEDPRGVDSFAVEQGRIFAQTVIYIAD